MSAVLGRVVGRGWEILGWVRCWIFTYPTSRLSFRFPQLRLSQLCIQKKVKISLYLCKKDKSTGSQFWQLKTVVLVRHSLKIRKGSFNFNMFLFDKSYNWIRSDNERDNEKHIRLRVTLIATNP